MPVAVQVVRNGRLDLVAKHACVFRRAFTWVDEDGTTPRDTSGYTARLVVKAKQSDATALYEYDQDDAVTLGGDDGAVSFEIPDTVMATLVPAGSMYWWDLTLIEPGGQDVAFLAGALRVTYDVVTDPDSTIIVRGVGVQGAAGTGIEDALLKAQNLADLEDVADARDNLGLGTAATADVGDFDTVGAAATAQAAAIATAASDATTKANAAQTAAVASSLQKASNLSDLANAGTARTNLGLGNVANTAPADLPISTATQAALDDKAAIADAVMDGDTAGGVLSGTYPNPGFAVDMATQAELNAAVSGLDSDIADVASDLATHTADTTGVHGIADTSALETQSGAQAKADAAQAAAVQRANHTGTQTASTISDFAAAVGTAGSGVFQPADATLSALAGVSTAADKLPYFDGTDDAAVTDFTATGRAVVGAADGPAARTAIGAATAAAPTLITATGNGTLDINPLITAGYTRISGLLQAGGSGGGSGRRGAAGTVRCGGGPGAPGGCTAFDFSLAALLALFPTGLIPYNVGLGTAGGAAVTTDDTNGNAGAGPSSATNATWIGAAPGNALCLATGFVNGAGAGGTNATGAAGAVGNGGTIPLLAGSSASVTGAVAVQASRPWPGPGGGITAANAASSGGSGTTGVSGGVQGSGGTVDTTPPTQGTQPTGVRVGPGPGPGGGAASITTAAQAGADGLPGSGQGGGGGGASLNGNASGAGGAGGSGFIQFIAS